MLSAERLREVLDYDRDTGIFRWRVSPQGRVAAGSRAGSFDRYGYRHITICKTMYLEHRLVWLYLYGSWPYGGIDHVNLDKADNRINNLRVATRSQNHANRRAYKSGRSGFKGASYHKRVGRWQAQIQKDKKLHCLGYFGTAEEAHAAYCEAAERLHGEFARTG